MPYFAVEFSYSHTAGLRSNSERRTAGNNTRCCFVKFYDQLSLFLTLSTLLRLLKPKQTLSHCINCLPKVSFKGWTRQETASQGKDHVRMCSLVPTNQQSTPSHSIKVITNLCRPKPTTPARQSHHLLDPPSAFPYWRQRKSKPPFPTTFKPK